MDTEDFQLEELVIAESVGLAFHGLDLVVGAFQRAGGKETIGVRLSILTFVAAAGRYLG
jgi:hypothetical protein